MHRDEACLYQTDVSGQNCLHLACFKGHSILVRLLADFKADFGHRDEGGNTALHRAIVGEELGIAQMLISRGLCSVFDTNAAEEDAFGVASKTNAVVNKQFLQMHDHCLAEEDERVRPANEWRRNLEGGETDLEAAVEVGGGGGGETGVARGRWDHVVPAETSCVPTGRYAQVGQTWSDTVSPFPHDVRQDESGRNSQAFMSRQSVAGGGAKYRPQKERVPKK